MTKFIIPSNAVTWPVSEPCCRAAERHKSYPETKDCVVTPSVWTSIMDDSSVSAFSVTCDFVPPLLLHMV